LSNEALNLYAPYTSANALGKSSFVLMGEGVYQYSSSFFGKVGSSPYTDGDGNMHTKVYTIIFGHQ
jgi:hypothetical protein